MGRGALLAALAALALPAAAGAENLAPTQGELAWSRSVAVAYWHVQQPPCGREQILSGLLADSPGWADWTACSITFSTEHDWRDYPEKTCFIYVHEFGHLVLGPTYFAASNPSDPMHSPNVSNVMYGTSPRTTQQEDKAMRGVGCLAQEKRRLAGAVRRHHRGRPRRA